MEYLTTCVKWCSVPEAHINFDQSDSRLLKWFITRYVCDSQHLTLICVKVRSADVSQVMAHSLDTMNRLWSTSSVEEMALGSFTDVAMTINCMGKPGITEYCTTHTPVSFMTSFYEYVQDIMGLMKSAGWTPRLELTTSDNDTSFRMICEHEPHSVSVVTEDGPTKLLRVHCNQPQTIYELLFKHGLVCSSVWSTKIHLSARAPCCALAYHHLTVIKVHIIPPKSEFNDFPKLQGLYQKMKFIKVRAQQKVMRYHPYHVPLLGPARPCPWQDDFFLYNEINMIPVAIYYHSSMSTLADIVKADGRFLDSVGCMEVSVNPEALVRVTAHHSSLDSTLGHTRVKDLDSNVNIVLFGDADQENDDSDDELIIEDPPFSCPSCKALANVYIIGCGHLCCKSCLKASHGTQSEAKCGICRSAITSTAPIYHTSASYDKCVKCGDKKTWVTECGHIICPCERVICRVCGYHPLTEIRRVFTTS